MRKPATSRKSARYHCFLRPHSATITAHTGRHTHTHTHTHTQTRMVFDMTPPVNDAGQSWHDVFLPILQVSRNSNPSMENNDFVCWRKRIFSPHGFKSAFTFLVISCCCHPWSFSTTVSKLRGKISTHLQLVYAVFHLSCIIHNSFRSVFKLAASGMVACGLGTL